MSYTDISLDDYLTQFKNADYYLIDVREADEYADGHLPGTVNLPLSELEQRYSEIRRDKPIVLVCARGGRSAQAAEYLAYLGYQNLYNLEGGTLGYMQAGHPLEK
ncbi:MAG: rhodanese-like domain-containing protein [Anaerolineae bacterium]